MLNGNEMRFKVWLYIYICVYKKLFVKLLDSIIFPYKRFAGTTIDPTGNNDNYFEIMATW